MGAGARTFPQHLAGLGEDVAHGIVPAVPAVPAGAPTHGRAPSGLLPARWRVVAWAGAGEHAASTKRRSTPVGAQRRPPPHRNHDSLVGMVRVRVGNGCAAGTRFSRAPPKPSRTRIAAMEGALGPVASPRATVVWYSRLGDEAAPLSWLRRRLRSDMALVWDQTACARRAARTRTAALAG